MSTLPPDSTFDSSQAAARSPRRSLHRQLTKRFAVVFTLVALLGTGAALVSYRGVVGHAQSSAANDTEQHVRKSYQVLQDDWQRNAEEVKAQVDFMRIFVHDGTDSWLRLRAYFAALEGKVGKFPSGVVMDSAGKAVFHFGIDGVALGQQLEADRARHSWYYSNMHRTVYALKSVPLWLGVQGTGRLVLMQPVDAGTLRKLAPLDVSLYLVMNERVVASSAGSQDIGKPLPGVSSGGTMLDGPGVQQRILPAFTDDAAAPQLVLRQLNREPLSMATIVSVLLALLMALALILWQVVGRWAQGVAQRVGALSQATGEFARSHRLTGSVRSALDRAMGSPDEITAVAEVSQGLMHGVVAYDEEHFAFVQTLDILEEGVVELDRNGRYLRASPGWIKLAGGSCDMGGLLFDSLHPEDVKALAGQFAHLFSGGKTNVTGRLRLNRPGVVGDIWAEYRFVPGVAGADGLAGVRGVLRDVTQSYMLEKHISHMALHDALTGLPNRVLLEDRAKIAVRMAERAGRKVAIGFIDLDHFKDINDHFGHTLGDQVLVNLAIALRECLRSGDTLARWGGDEFVVLLSDVADLEGAREAAAKLLTACERAILIDGSEFNVTFSMGVALYPDDAQSTEALLSQADRAMFHAKELGRNNVRFFADVLQKDESRRALYIQNRLAGAIKNHQIQVWFQPVISADSRGVVGCEALARWNDESYGWVSPATFIPMAENLGLISELGMQVWREAFRSLKRWRDMGMDLTMAINISRRQLFTPSFTEELLADLERFAIPALCVELEITESVAMEHAQHTSRRLQELVAAGFGLAIDDFGTGYSSLSQLHNMPSSKLKIDISFVRRIHEPQGAQLVRAIVQMAQAFRLDTVAEGVEDAQTAATLQAMGVTMLQGYHFGKPMPADEFERLFVTPMARSPA